MRYDRNTEPACMHPLLAFAMHMQPSLCPSTWEHLRHSTYLHVGPVPCRFNEHVLGHWTLTDWNCNKTGSECEVTPGGEGVSAIRDATAAGTRNHFRPPRDSFLGVSTVRCQAGDAIDARTGPQARLLRLDADGIQDLRAWHLLRLSLRALCGWLLVILS